MITIKYMLEGFEEMQIEHHDGDGSTEIIFTRNYPIQSVAMVAIGYDIKYAETSTGEPTDDCDKVSP